MIRKTLTLAPLALVATLGQAAETVKIYNWSSYIAPDLSLIHISEPTRPY